MTRILYFLKKDLTTTRMCGIINTEIKEEVIIMDDKKKKSTIQIVDLIIKAVVALAALISAIKWW